MVNAIAVSPPKLNPRARLGVGRLMLAGAALLAGAVLFAIDPAKHEIYPTCWLYATTGLQCPGCGGLRATHQLLHGHLAAAWALNPLAILLVPLYAWFGVDVALRLLHGSGLPQPRFRPAWLWLGVGALLLFGVLRNFPLW